MAHSKVSRPAALHSSVVKSKWCCWPKATCPHTPSVYLLEGCNTDHTDCGNVPDMASLQAANFFLEVTVSSQKLFTPIWLHCNFVCLVLPPFWINNIIHSCRECIYNSWLCIVTLSYVPASVLFCVNCKSKQGQRCIAQLVHNINSKPNTNICMKIYKYTYNNCRLITFWWNLLFWMNNLASVGLPWANHRHRQSVCSLNLTRIIRA